MFYFDLAGETVVSALCARLRWRVRNSHERVACRLRAYAVSSIETCSTCSLVRLGFGMGVGTVACTFVSLSSLFFLLHMFDFFTNTQSSEHEQRAEQPPATPLSSRDALDTSESQEISHIPVHRELNVFLLLLGRLIRSYLGLSTSWHREPACTSVRATRCTPSVVGPGGNNFPLRL